MTQAGTLFIVATPIGNLKDITLRALEVLGEVDVIAAEDTRHSQQLLNAHNIHTRCLSLHDHNESQRAGQIIDKLQQGLNIALISDAGTPLISDPGYHLVSQARNAGCQVLSVPGPCAAIAALCASGLPTDKFQFAGFLPVKKMARDAEIEALISSAQTTVFYESPRRVLDSLSDIARILGEERPVVLAKELTKTFENVIGSTAAEIQQWLLAEPGRQKGEFVLMIGPAAKKTDEIPTEALALLQLLTEALPLKKAAAIVAGHYDLKKNKLYQLGLELNDH